MAYVHRPVSTSSLSFVGVLVFMEFHRRILGGKFGEIPKPISDDAFSMSGYCLDAPELLPAGACRFREVGPEPDDWIVEQATVERG